MINTDKIIEGVKKSLIQTPFGKIKIALKQHTDKECTSIIVEKRTRFVPNTPHSLILDAMRVAIDSVEYGKITLELRGTHSPIDLVVETHTQYT